MLLETKNPSFKISAKPSLMPPITMCTRFLNEEQNPKGGCHNEIDFSRLGAGDFESFKPPPLDKILSETGLVRDNGEYVSTDYDTSSVMRYLISPEYFLPESRNYCTSLYPGEKTNTVFGSNADVTMTLKTPI
jgi:hypothetical protein